MHKLLRIFIFLALATAASAGEYRARQFIGYSTFDAFSRSSGNGDTILLSPRIKPVIAWNEVIPSWNYQGPPQDGLRVELKAIYPNQQTAWYNLGDWSLDPAIHPRQSQRNQKDADGTVDTDILKLLRPGGELQVRITLRQAEPNLSALKFLGLAFADTTATLDPLPPNQAAWGRTLQVKRRSQVNYPDGVSEWCSPTSISMLLSFWSTNLHRGDLDYDVPEAASSIHDPNWPGTGNWPFNTAFAGSHPGIRAFVTRFSDVSEIEDWIAGGIPIALSVSSSLLKGRDTPGNGHLVVAIGFDQSGDPITNDPGRSHVQQKYTRANLIRAWAHSNNTVYLVFPEDHPLPKDRFHHWTP